MRFVWVWTVKISLLEGKYTLCPQWMVERYLTRKAKLNGLREGPIKGC